MVLVLNSWEGNFTAQKSDLKNIIFFHVSSLKMHLIFGRIPSLSIKQLASSQPPKGCRSLSILPSRMGARGVSLEHVENMENTEKMENMEMFSRSPTEMFSGSPT